MSTFGRYFNALDRGEVSQLSRRSGVSRQQLYNLAAGKSSPSIKTMDRIEKATRGKVPFGSWQPSKQKKMAIENLI